MNIKVWDYLVEYKKNKKEILKIVNSVFSSGQLILGDQVKLLEKNFSNFINVKFGIGVNSGTDALQISLMAANIGKNDEVITVPNTAVPTVSAIVSAGAKPVFVDVNKEDCLINVSQIENAISKKTKAIIPVHLYGQCANMDSIIKLAKKYNLKVIEDCAQSAGAYYKNKPSGSFGDLSAFSFYPTKVLGGYGDGGFVGTSNKKLAQQSYAIRKYGMKELYYSEQHGINSRLDEIQAAILNYKLKKLNTWIKRRRQIASFYNKHLKNTSLKLPKENNKNYHVYYVYVVQHPERNRIIKEMKKNKIFCNISYPFPIHTMRGYKYLNYRKGDFPVSEKLAENIFSLPMYPQLTNKMISKIIYTIKKIGI